MVLSVDSADHHLKCVVIRSESPVAVVTPVGPVRVRVGDPINLECQASGEPRPSVSWHRLDNNRKTMLRSPVPMDSNAVMQVPMCRAQANNQTFYFLFCS